MTRDETYSFEVNFITKMKKHWSIKKPVRTTYLWANIIIIDDEDERCPTIEG
ncbi:hypothetical protein OAT73_00800 [Candidatus Poseidoniaceae archaeon]|nr:hypothetical protein [Euryarchaeota archaeon]MDC3235783.1 hypothetical protein [Candidatus Poseidoniaceae archaeon]